MFHAVCPELVVDSQETVSEALFSFDVDCDVGPTLLILSNLESL